MREGREGRERGEAMSRCPQSITFSMLAAFGVKKLIAFPQVCVCVCEATELFWSSILKLNQYRALNYFLFDTNTHPYHNIRTIHLNLHSGGAADSVGEEVEKHVSLHISMFTFS